MNASKLSSQSVSSSQQTFASTPSPAKAGTAATMKPTPVFGSPSHVEGEDEAGFSKVIPADADAKDSPQISFDEDESSTVYNVVMDDFSLASTASSRKVEVSYIESELDAAVPSPKAQVSTAEAESNMPAAEPSAESPTEAGTKLKKQLRAENVQVVLLLMAINSRRFELLQLEFDPNKANVSDVLAQVSSAATEDELRSQKYTGICSSDGTELPAELLLKNVVHSENEVMIALPEGATAFSCTKLAAPILNDPKVRSLVRIHTYSDFNLSPCFVVIHPCDLFSSMTFSFCFSLATHHFLKRLPTRKGNCSPRCNQLLRGALPKISLKNQKKVVVKFCHKVRQTRLKIVIRSSMKSHTRQVLLKQKIRLLCQSFKVSMSRLWLSRKNRLIPM
jgi:hypothetical protein